MKSLDVFKLIAVTFLYLVVNVAVSYLVVAVYAYLIRPGEPDQYYLDWAQVSAPWSSVIAGMPLMFLVGWWVSRWKSVSNPVLAMGSCLDHLCGAGSRHHHDERWHDWQACCVCCGVACHEADCRSVGSTIRGPRENGLRPVLGLDGSVIGISRPLIAPGIARVSLR